jgi:hypothetical protein
VLETREVLLLLLLPISLLTSCVVRPYVMMMLTYNTHDSELCACVVL